MSTYLQGSNDYIPQIQPFTPDYNFYAGTLNFKQGKHDAARQQLSTLYGSLLNAPLTREDNAATRDKFFKAIEQDIHKMAGMDLSLAQNQQAAAGIFNQLLDNKNVVKDMVWTRGYQQQTRKSQGFKNCVNMEECGGGWWEGGDRLLQYQRDAFKNASAEDAMNMGSAEYTPYQDLTSEALKLAKEADLNVSLDQVTGQWITTTKNGPLIVEPLNNLLQGKLAQNPKMMAYYNAQAKLKRQDYMYSNEAAYGSKEAAEAAYISEMTPLIDKLYGTKDQELEDKQKTTAAEREKVEQAIATAPPDQVQDLQSLRESLFEEESSYAASAADAKEVKGHMEVAQRNQRYTGTQIDRIMASVNLGQDIQQNAMTLSQRNYSQTKAVNPYALENVKFKNRLALEEFKHRNTMELEKWKVDIETQGGYESNVPEAVEGLKGGVDVKLSDPTSKEHKQRVFTAFKKDYDKGRQGLSSNEAGIITEVMSRTERQADNGDIRAKKDMVRMAAQYLRATTKSSQVIGQGFNVAEDSRSGKDTPLMSRAEKMQTFKLGQMLAQAPTLNEKYAIAKQMNMDLNKISGSQLDYFYDNTVEGFLDPNKTENKVLRSHLRSTWDKTATQRKAIRHKGRLLEQWHEFHNDQNKDVVAQFRTNPEASQLHRDMLDSYIDSKGAVVDEQTFIQNMVQKGHKPFASKLLYRSDVERPGIWDQTKADLAFGFSGLQSEAEQMEAFRNMSPENQQTVIGILNSGERGVHDLYKEAFTTYARPEGAQTFHGVVGAGDEFARGQRYSRLDPAEVGSIGNQSTVGMMRDALNDKTAVFNFGGFAEETSENNDAARKALQTIYHDFQTDFKGDNRPILDVTFANVAAGDGNKVGLNVKIPEIYRKKYKGSVNNPGDFAMEGLTTEGITLYMDRDKTNSLFVTGTENTMLENLMKWDDELTYDTFPEYQRDTKLTNRPEAGGYVFSGMFRDGLNEDGTPNWNYRETFAPYGVDLNDLDAQINDKLGYHAHLNYGNDTEYTSKNKQ